MSLKYSSWNYNKYGHAGGAKVSFVNRGPGLSMPINSYASMQII